VTHSSSSQAVSALSRAARSHAAPSPPPQTPLGSTERAQHCLRSLGPGCGIPHGDGDSGVSTAGDSAGTGKDVLTPPPSCSRGPSVAQGKWYGVRSYLHLFYEDCTGTGPDGDTDGSSPSHPHGVWPSIIWKVTLSAGTLFLLAGVAALSTGWLVPPGLEGIKEDKEEELVVLDMQAVRYNHVPGVCRLLGTALCITAAVLGAVGLLCWVLGRAWGGRQEEEQQQLSPILQSSPQGHMVPFGASQLHGVLLAGGARLGALLLLGKLLGNPLLEAVRVGGGQGGSRGGCLGRGAATQLTGVVGMQWNGME
uniref:Neurensin 2 n=1 Tax=Gallus gallus TaxID=9031 RepID=A0A8V0YU07_CHICK